MLDVPAATATAAAVCGSEECCTYELGHTGTVGLRMVEHCCCCCYCSGQPAGADLTGASQCPWNTRAISVSRWDERRQRQRRGEHNTTLAAKLSRVTAEIRNRNVWTALETHGYGPTLGTTGRAAVPTTSTTTAERTGSTNELKALRTQSSLHLYH